MIESFTVSESEELYALLAKYSAQFPVDSREFYLLMKDMSETRGRM